jgi:hypothetical protein
MGMRAILRDLRKPDIGDSRTAAATASRWARRGAGSFSDLSPMNVGRIEESTIKAVG